MANNKEKQLKYGSSVKEREIQRLENSALRRLNKNYANEMYNLLYFSKNYNNRNYSKKRININKYINREKNCKTIDNNETLYDNIYIQLSKPKIKLSTIINQTEKNETENKKADFFMNAEESKDLFEKLRTKHNINFLNNKEYDTIKNEHLRPKMIKNDSLPKLNSLYPSLDSPTRHKVYNKPIKLEIVSGFDKNLAKCVEKNLFCDKLTKNQKSDLKYINELKFFNYVDKMNKKSKLINDIKGYDKNKKVLKRNFYNYDKEKWEKYKNLNRNESGIIANKLKNDNKKNLYNMENDVKVFCSELIDAREDLNNHLNNLDTFMTKNGILYDENKRYEN